MMIADRTLGSNLSAQQPRRPLEKKKPRSENIFARSRTRDRKNLKSPSPGNRRKFCFKDPETMEPAETHRSCHSELVEGKLRELASKWFIETQAPLIVHNGLFPTWFMGFINRRDAEDILREKEPGCFLVRLSDKVIGYILSYRGGDRCRHFVINQNEERQFVVCGDDKEHESVPELIRYYRSQPIQPFGEFLTSSCCEALNEDPYDIIQISPKEKPADGTGKNTQVNSERTRTQTPKSSRTSEEVPPLPQRSWLHTGATAPDPGAAPDPDAGLLYAHLRKHSPRPTPRSHHPVQDLDPVRPDRSTSLGAARLRPSSSSSSSAPNLLERNSPDSSPSLGERRLAPPPHTPARLAPKPATPRPRSLEIMGNNAVYHLVGEHGSAGAGSGSVPAPRRRDSVPQDDTYEQIPDWVYPNYYEPLEDVRPKVVKCEKWKWLCPDARRKW